MAEWHWSEAELEAEIEAAMRAGAVAATVGPRARAARAEPDGSRLVVELTNGAVLSLPFGSIETLAEAPAEERAKVTVVAGGEGLRWESLDVDLGVPGLLVGVLGSPRWMRRLAHEAA